MSSFPSITGAKAVATFKKFGFCVVRTTGSHRIMKKDGHQHRLSIPVHKGKTIGVGLLKSQIAAAGLTEDQFVKEL